MNTVKLLITNRNGTLCNIKCNVLLINDCTQKYTEQVL